MSETKKVYDRTSSISRISSETLLLTVLLILITSAAFTLNAQQVPTPKPDVLTPSEKKEVSDVAKAVSKRLRMLQTKANVRVMGTLEATERNTRLACTLANEGILKEKEGTEVGVVSFKSSDPVSDLALLKLVTFPTWRLEGEYGFQRFDVAVWPVRHDSSDKKTFAVRVEMRQGLYWDWADSHITDDSLNKDWWRSIVSPECK